MKPVNLLAALAAAAILSAPAAAARDGSPRSGQNAPGDTPQTKGSLKLAKLLEGREAGEPRSCVRSLPSENIEVIDGTALIVGRGRTIYVNVPQDPASLDDDDILVIRKHSGSSLCRLDWIEMRDRLGGYYSGNVLLNEFVPYTRVDRESRSSGSGPS